jgi:hypothetical protein
MKHWETHPTYVEGCFACKITQVSVSATAMPGRKPETISSIAQERHWNEDMAAYKRLRADGVQPPQIDNCKVLERHAEHEKQITMGKLYDPKKIKQADAMSADLGVKLP